jgi:hypothetical protein
MKILNVTSLFRSSVFVAGESVTSDDDDDDETTDDLFTVTLMDALFFLKPNKLSSHGCIDRQGDFKQSLCTTQSQ